MTVNMALVHSNLNFAHHFVIYWLFQNDTNKNWHQESHQRETIPDKFVFFFSKLVRQKKKKMSIGWAIYIYVCEWDLCWRNFCNFSLVTKKCERKVGQNSPFFKWAPFWNFIFKKENDYVFFEVNYLDYTKKTQFRVWQLHFPSTFHTRLVIGCHTSSWLHWKG